MNSERRYQPEQWRTVQTRNERAVRPHHTARMNPDVNDQSHLLGLLGRINYNLFTGKRVYIQVGGVVYKTLYGGYWRSVFTGVEHHLLKCVEIPYQGWKEGNAGTTMVDLPIAYSQDGWTTMGLSISFIGETC